MSEKRTPDIILLHRLPQIQGKKATKIELFYASHWGQKWEPRSALFTPKPPLHSANRKEYWESRYRVRLGGKWVKDKGVQYTMLTK